LKANITTLGPLVLPVSEQLLFAGNMIARKIWGRKAVRPYVPDFTTAFTHICIHTGGRGVIDEIEKHLQLDKALIEPSRAALYRYVCF
jgi:3-ketoacyl-CoA synthase